MCLCIKKNGRSNGPSAHGTAVDISSKSEENRPEGCILLMVCAVKMPAEDITKRSLESGSRPIQKLGLKERSAFVLKCPPQALNRMFSPNPASPVGGYVPSLLREELEPSPWMRKVVQHPHGMLHDPREERMIHLGHPLPHSKPGRVAMRRVLTCAKRVCRTSSVDPSLCEEEVGATYGEWSVRTRKRKDTQLP